MPVTDFSIHCVEEAEMKAESKLIPVIFLAVCCIVTFPVRLSSQPAAILFFSRDIEGTLSLSGAGPQQTCF